jgi:predicted nucleic acid-binding protein
MTHKTSNFNPNHIFVDTNVLVGGYSGDARFKRDEACLHYLYSLAGKRLYISSLSVAQLISTFQKKKKNDEIIRIVRDLQHRCSYFLRWAYCEGGMPKARLKTLAK